MRQVRVAITVFLLVLIWGCDKKDKEVVEEPVFELKTCPVTSIRVTPEHVSDPGLVIRSGFSVDLAAAAVDQTGGLTGAPELTWSLRYPDSDSDQSSGAGHRLTVLDNTHARFTASGLASGVFTVLVQDRSCNQADDDRPQYPEGQAWITVSQAPGSESACGRMRVTYGDRIDRMGDEVLASSKVTLIAEVFGRHKLGRQYKIQFYLDEKPYPGKRPVYRDNTVPAVPGMEVGHLGLLPIYLTPGEHRVRYELEESGQPVCGSRVERFSAR